jgi:hypothetical protein
VRKTFVLAALLIACTIIFLGYSAQLRAQVNPKLDASSGAANPVVPPFSDSRSSVDTVDSALPDPPEPATGAGRERPFTPPDMTEHWGPLSRISIGADVSPLGFGIKSAVVLTEILDGRLDTNLFFYNTGRFETSGVNVNANFHLASMAAKLDWYPHNSIWRLSPGLMFFNGNRLSANLRMNGGSSFGVNGTTYYSANPNPVTGATPLTGNVAVGLNSRKPEFTVSGGWGRFVPHSHRHWSFPSEFGVVFMGAPSLNVALSGWACTDNTQTVCSNIADPTNPVSIQFNQNLQSALTKWRRDLGKVQIYPIFSYSFMYSFDMP